MKPLLLTILVFLLCFSAFAQDTTGEPQETDDLYLDHPTYPSKPLWKGEYESPEEIDPDEGEWEIEVIPEEDNAREEKKEDYQTKSDILETYGEPYWQGGGTKVYRYGITHSKGCLYSLKGIRLLGLMWLQGKRFRKESRRKTKKGGRNAKVIEAYMLTLDSSDD